MDRLSPPAPILPFPDGGTIQPTSFATKTIDDVDVDVRTFASDPHERCRICTVCEALPKQDGGWLCIVKSRRPSPLTAFPRA
jgi:hypothetical protein